MITTVINNLQSLKNRLLKYQNQLVVIADKDLQTQLIKEAYAQVSTAYLGKTKTCKIIMDRYYQLGMATNIDRYIRNCNDYRKSTILQDKTLGLLKPLLVLERPWQHVLIDFYKLLKDRNRYDIVLILVDRFGKRMISIPCYKTTNAKEITQLYI